MRKLTAFLLGWLGTAVVYADVWQAPYGVSETFYFHIYNTDGTLDDDAADGGTDVSVICDGGTPGTATNDFVDEGSGTYSITLTAGELQCQVTAIEVASTTTVGFFVQTFGDASAMFNQFPADAELIEGSDATDQINEAADAAIETYHLDHLLAVDYDPSSKPGTATALFNELIENDGGVSRFTANALEQGPSGGGALTDDDLGYWTTTIATVNSQTEFVLTAGTADDNAYDGWGVILQDQSDSDQRSLRYGSCSTGYAGSTLTLTLSSAADFTVEVGDTIILAPAFSCADGSTLSSIPWNSAWDAEVQSEATDAINAYDPTTDTEFQTAMGSFNDFGSGADLANNLIDIEALVDDLETRLTATRAGYLDNLSAGAVALEATLGTPADTDIATDIANLPTAADVVDNFETQSQADPTGFHVNLMEINSVAITGDGSGTPFNVASFRDFKRACEFYGGRCAEFTRAMFRDLQDRVIEFEQDKAGQYSLLQVVAEL